MNAFDIVISFDWIPKNGDVLDCRTPGAVSLDHGDSLSVYKALSN